MYIDNHHSAGPSTAGDEWDEISGFMMESALIYPQKHDVAVSDTTTIVLGVCLSLFGSLFTSSGLVLQKYSWMMREGDQFLFCRWRWWLGFLLLVVAAGLMEAWALAICPLTLISSLCGITIVSNTLFSVYFLDEGKGVDNTVWLSLLVVVVGTTTAAVCGSSKSAGHDAPELTALFEKWHIPFYYTLVVVNVVASGLCIRFGSCQRLFEGHEALLLANIAGVVGGNQNLLLKCFMELVAESFRAGGSSQFHEPFTYGVLLGACVLAVLQLYVMNVGLNRHPAVVFLPAYQSLLTVYGCAAGMTFFGEHAGDILTAKNAGFVAGILVTLFGLYLYTLHYRGSMLTEDQAETARLIKLKDHDDPARDREVAERGHPIL